MIACQASTVLLDVEGTTSSIAFVYDVMFPFARREVEAFLRQEASRPDVQQALDFLACDAGMAKASDWGNITSVDVIERIVRHVHEAMDQDSKATGLKALQGLVWESGFRSGQLESHLFDDCFPALKRWQALGKTLAIYSSGSVVAQKLFFGHTLHGDLRPFFRFHFDTTVGPKRDAASYLRIAQAMQVSPESILFLSDVAAELEAALGAGCQAIAVIRPGNAALPNSYTGPRVSSFDELVL